MIEETAVVVAVDGDAAEVETRRRDACGSCDARAGCGSALLAGVFGNRPSRIRVLNRVHAQPGDRVIIGLREGPFLRAAFALYTLPLLTMIGGAVLGEWLARRSDAGSLEIGSLIGAAAGLAAGLLWLRRFAHRSRDSSDYRAVVLRRVPRSGVSVPLQGGVGRG